MIQFDIEKEHRRIGNELEELRAHNRKICISSSFQTHSIPLLHIVSVVAPDTDVLFLDTGFHFPETYNFKDEMGKLLNLNVLSLRSQIPKIRQRNAEGVFYYADDPDHCCFLNKTQPMNDAMQLYDVWISGVRRDQNANRKSMDTLTKTPGGKMRYHPILEWSNKDIHQYRKHYNLPAHPMEERGYLSIGCEPCTQKFNPDDAREGRWAGMKKTECGLHTDLIAK